MNKLIEKHLRKATSRCPHKRHMVGAVIVSKGGEILGDGCAHVSNIRLSELSSVHAEIHALGRARHENLKGAIVYVRAIARKSNNIVVGKPCLTCAIAMKTAGIDTVIYSVSEGRTGTLDLESDLSKLKVYKKREGL